MSTEQQLREAVERRPTTGFTIRDLDRIMAAVGRLLDPIPDETVEDAAWAIVHFREVEALSVLGLSIADLLIIIEAYRAWLIGGNE